MYKEIESSKLYIKSINDYINFHIDESGDYWRDYDKICEVLNGYNQNDEIYDYIIECISSSKTADLIRSQIK